MLGFIIPESKPRVVSEGEADITDSRPPLQVRSPVIQVHSLALITVTVSMCVVSFVGDDKLIFTILFSISINFLYCFSQHFNGEQPKITNISNSF